MFGKALSKYILSDLRHWAREIMKSDVDAYNTSLHVLGAANSFHDYMVQLLFPKKERPVLMYQLEPKIFYTNYSLQVICKLWSLRLLHKKLSQRCSCNKLILYLLKDRRCQMIMERLWWKTFCKICLLNSSSRLTLTRKAMFLVS